MLDRVLALAALSTLIGFMLILVGFVTDIDLIVVVIVVGSMAAYDFYLTAFKRSNGD